MPFLLTHLRRHLFQWLQQNSHIAIEGPAQRNQGIYLRLVDVLLPLFKLLDSTQGDSRLLGKLSLGQPRLTAQAFQVRLSPLTQAKFVHLVHEMPDIHLVIRRVKRTDFFKRNSLDDVRKLHGREIFTPPHTNLLNFSKSVGQSVGQKCPTYEKRT